MWLLTFQAKKAEGLLKPGADMSVFKDVAGEAERLDIKENKGVMVLVELLLDETIIKQVFIYTVRAQAEGSWNMLLDKPLQQRHCSNANCSLIDINEGLKVFIIERYIRFLLLNWSW